MSGQSHAPGAGRAGNDKGKSFLEHRDPIEQALWERWFPSIATWVQRPYVPSQAKVLHLAAAACLFKSKETPDQQTWIAWRNEQMRFIAMMELRTHGAIGDRLEQAGDTRMAAWVRKLAAPLVARVDSSRKEEAEQRTGLKELLSVSGLPTLLSDERYEPRLPFGHRKDEPTVLPFTLEQISLLGRAVVKVKDAYDPQEPDDGLRVFIDREPPRTVLARWIQVDAWLDEPRPSRHLFDWFGQDPERWAEFEHHYHRELRFQPYAMERTLKRLSRGPFTLLHKKRGEFSVARALANYLLKHYPHVFEAG